MAVKYLVQHRRGTAGQWAEQSTLIPGEGEIVIEIDEVNSLHKLKIGDGVHTYAELAYLQAGDEIVTQVLNKAQPRVVTVELTLNWTLGENNTYSQVIALDNITKHSRLDLQPSAAMIAEFKELGLVFVTENNGGEITVYSIGNKPLKSYTMQATIVEVECTGDNVIGVPVVAPKDAITRADITDFAYTHSDEVGEEFGFELADPYLKVTVHYTYGMHDFQGSGTYYDLYVIGGYGASGHWTIQGDSTHSGDTWAHCVYTHPGLYNRFELHNQMEGGEISDTEAYCTFYIKDHSEGYATNVYIDDRGITDNKIISVEVERVDGLPEFTNSDEISELYSSVDVNEYAELQAKAEAAAPQATTYTKDEVDNKIASLDYTDNDYGIVYKVDQTDGVIKPYKKLISRDYITDFRYTHKAVVDLETTPPNAKYLKVTVGSPDGWTSMLYKMYVFSYWLAAEVEISTDSSHRTGFGGGFLDKVHSATIFTENLVKLVDKIEPAEGSCSFYLEVGGSIKYNGCTVYIDDESGMSDSGTPQKVTSLDVALVEELPTDAKTFDRIFTVVDKAEYEAVKERANAAAPQSITYTKDEVDELIRQNAYDAVGVTIQKTVFTDRPSLWTWLQENYRSALKVTIKTAEYHASNFGVAITEDQDGTVHFEVSRQIVSTSGDATRSSVYTFEVYNNKVVQYSSCDYIGPDGSVTHSVLDNGITILDEEWAATGIELTVYYFDE